MTIDDLRALALWHRTQASTVADPKDSAWHAAQAGKLEELAAAFSHFGSELAAAIPASP